MTQASLPTWLLEILACPACNHPLSQEGTCARGHQWDLQEEVPDFIGTDAPLGEAYNRMADIAERRAVDEPARFTEIDRALLAAATGRTLDLGCGVGRMLGPLEERCDHVVGVDLSRESLARARRRGHTVLCADGLRLPFRTRSFHAVVAGFGTFAHLPVEGAAREVSRVLLPGGRLAFHNFGGHALTSAQLLGGVVRLERPRLSSGFHTDVIRRWPDVEGAMDAAGLHVEETEGRLHVPGLARLTDRRVRVRRRSLLPWCWDVVVVARKGP